MKGKAKKPASTPPTCVSVWPLPAGSVPNLQGPLSRRRLPPAVRGHELPPPEALGGVVILPGTGQDKAQSARRPLLMLRLQWLPQTRAITLLNGRHLLPPLSQSEGIRDDSTSDCRRWILTLLFCITIELQNLEDEDYAAITFLNKDKTTQRKWKDIEKTENSDCGPRTLLWGAVTGSPRVRWGWRRGHRGEGATGSHLWPRAPGTPRACYSLMRCV